MLCNLGMKTLIHPILSMLGVALLAAPASTWNVRNHIPLSEFIVQSHRGAGVLSAENSIQAFQIAWDLHTIPEADLRTTADGIIVAFHDKDFSRILPDAPDELQQQGIEDLRWQEVAQLDIGSWKGREHAGQRVPQMNDLYAILAENPLRRLYVDIKNVDLAQLASESQQVHPQLILASTDYGVIQQWKKLAPDSYTLHWMGGDRRTLNTRIAKLREQEFAAIDQLQIHVRFSELGEITPSEPFLRQVGDELRTHGILFQVLPWNNNDPRVFSRLMDLGVASFATDYPDVAMRAIREYYAAQKNSSERKRSESP